MLETGIPVSPRERLATGTSLALHNMAAASTTKQRPARISRRKVTACLRAVFRGIGVGRSGFVITDAVGLIDMCFVPGKALA